jgi:hypothetical protein
MTVWTVWLLVIMVHTSGGGFLFVTITSSSLLVKRSDAVTGHPMAVETFRDATIQPLSRPDLQPAGTSYTGDFALVESGYWANEALIN